MTFIEVTEVDIMVDFGWQCGGAVLCVIVLMRDVILQEIASWGINLARAALYIAEGITVSIISSVVCTILKMRNDYKR